MSASSGKMLTTTKREDRELMAAHRGRLELTWTDKDKTLLSTGDGKYDYTFVDPSDYRVSEVRLLHEVERIEAADMRPEGSDLPEPTTDNLLLTGDAMHVLDALTKIPEYADKYLGQVKLVYIDPPFNTGQAFSHYEDNIEHSIWLTMLRDRVRQIKPLLADDGSLWVHLDDVEVHRCRSVLDEEFGDDQFVGEIAWQKADSPRSDTKGISGSHDSILVYRKTSAAVFHRLPRTEAMNARFKSPDGDPEPWYDDNPTAPNPGTIFGIQHPITGEVLYPGKGNFWRREQAWFLAQMNEYAPYELRDIGDFEARSAIAGQRRVPQHMDAIMLACDRDVAEASARARLAAGSWPDVILRSGGEGRLGKKSRIPTAGRVPESWWSNAEVGHNREAKAEIKALFPGEHPFATPKPERLLQRIIRIATQPGDIVLDCFAGSGTTAAVAHKMGRRWVTSELLNETAETFTKPRLAKVVDGTDRGGVTTTAERIAVEEADLPEGMTPEEAHEFNRLLNKVTKANGLEVPKEVLKDLRSATRTRSVPTTNWHGGGGFAHLQVGPSMFEEVAGMVLLAEWATQGDLARAMCAQLGVRYRPDGIFAATRGRVRYVVLDGLVGESTIESILDQLTEGQIVEVWATQVEHDAVEALRKARPGSRLEAIPDSVLDSYRRKAAKQSPFKPRTEPAEEA